MSAPIWMAAPPEVHSALLSSGPGPGSMIAAASAWKSLAAEFVSAAEELSGLLHAVQAGAWEGPTAEQYVTAHSPYLAWLLQTGQNGTATAARLEGAAASYAAAVAAMPTLAEIAANHATHAVLLATNFFGINTIPIALNEADYVRMWIQAATTMSIYQAVSSAAVAMAPHSTPAPQIVKSAAAEPNSDPNDPFGLAALLQQLEQFEGGDSLLNLIWPGNPFTSYPPGTDPGTALAGIWQSFTDGLFVYDPQTLAFAHNPVQLIAVLALAATQLITHRIFDLLQLVYNFPQLLVAVVPLVVANAGAVGGLSGLAALAGQAQPVPALDPGPLPDGTQLQPAGGLVPVSAPAPAPVPTPVSAVPAPAAPAATPPPLPPATGAEVAAYPYLVGGGPGAGFGSGMSARVSAKSKTPTSEASAAAAVGTTRSAARARRRRRARVHEPARGYEYMDVDSNADDEVSASRDDQSSWATSDHSTRPLGFAGAIRKNVAPEAAAGLRTLSEDEFGGGPRMPLIPETWEQQHRRDNS